MSDLRDEAESLCRSLTAHYFPSWCATHQERARWWVYPSRRSGVRREWVSLRIPDCFSTPGELFPGRCGANWWRAREFDSWGEVVEFLRGEVEAFLL